MKKNISSLLFVLSFLGYSQEIDEVGEKQIEEIVFQKKNKSTDLTNVDISTRTTDEVASISGGVETLIKTLPSVNSNTELSSQYMVRGGNYDENMVYINDIEVYRPMLIRNSQQEGMSIINPNMVSMVNFSAGGFEAKYGDKMSSVLNIYYRTPQKNEFLGEVSLVGGNMTLGGISKNRKISALISARYRNNNLILNTLNEDTEFNPQYYDIQSYIKYKISDKWRVYFLGYWAKNIYEMLPNNREVEFGTLQNPIKLNIYYGGKENSRYLNMMGNISLNYSPNGKWNFYLDSFAYHNREREYYTISSAFFLAQTDSRTHYSSVSYDLGEQIDNARNDVLLRTFGSQFRTRFLLDTNTRIEAGIRLDFEDMKDLTNEWRYISYKGYNYPLGNYPLGILDSSLLDLNYSIQGLNDINSTKLSSFLQYSSKFYLGKNKAFLNAGFRLYNWSFNKETLFSPRIQFAIKPNWDIDMLFRISTGLYYQAINYKESKSIGGDINSLIKSQKSFQVIFANDYEFEWKDRPLKLVTEFYYKKMDNLIPYYIDNIRIRYSGENNSKGYSYGIDTRLFGEFVSGAESWVSASYARSYENIDNRGYIPRPTDQRLRFSMFYQDYMPKFPSMRANITLVYASGLPTGTPISLDKDGQPNFDSVYYSQRRLNSYKRVDIGLTKVFIDQKDYLPKSIFWSKFKELTLGLQIFNAFNIHNTVANQWINDMETGYYYPVPIRLTGRFFNAKLTFKF